MSSFTKKYINYFYKNKYNLPDNNNILLQLIKEKQQFLQFKKNIKIKINSHNYDDKLDHLLDSIFIQKHIIQKEINNLSINFSISWFDNIIYVKCDNIKNIIKKIKLLIYFIEYIKYKNNIKQNVKIYLLLTRLKKIYPNDWQNISVNNVNSGYCHNDDKYIFIWRLEEFCKVILHEVIHLFNLDDKDNKYCEGITDFIAVQYYLIFISIIKNIDIKLLLELEMAFQRNQAYVLMNIYKKENNFPLNTFSYYIIKYLLFLEKNKLIIDNNYKIIHTNSLRMTLIECC